MPPKEFTYHYLCNHKGIPMNNATKEIYDLIADPYILLAMVYLIKQSNIPPIIAIRNGLSDVYSKYNLNPSYMNPLAGRMIAHILGLMSIAPVGSKGVKAMTNGLMSSAATYSDVVPGSPSTFDRNNNPIAWYPQPVISLDIPNRQVVSAIFSSGTYVRIV